MFCGRCNQPIQPGEPYETADNVGATGPGAIVYLHKEQLCRRAPHQSEQVPYATDPRSRQRRRQRW